ncbi:hemerythrin domain-containing protein [Paenibacillus pinistramenti]|uniref:hemerythrin domain-containing protein n=1 Tax=Paenibacillus pinistramenti TaxID=1768003 RepID=UPI0011081B29|nr:hemerythrin domain-containing protein [Paenibacillus pinistramenti]
MSGPALRNVDSHSLIHEAALEEARELTGVLEHCLQSGELPKALEVAYVALEHWESRTLQHAASEEEGLYLDVLAQRPDLQSVITSLIRDHQLMRILAGEIKELLMRQNAAQTDNIKQVLHRFNALILIDHLHNEEEERMIGHEVGGHVHADEEAI